MALPVYKLTRCDRIKNPLLIFLLHLRLGKAMAGAPTLLWASIRRPRCVPRSPALLSGGARTGPDLRRHLTALSEGPRVLEDEP